MSFAAGTGEACILAGDFNLTQDMWPVSTACAAGRRRAADEMILGDAAPPGTHTRGTAHTHAVLILLLAPLE